MTAPNPDGYKTYMFLPVSAVLLRQNQIQTLQKRVASLEKQTSATKLDGQGVGLGIPDDQLSPGQLQPPKTKVRVSDIVPEDAGSSGQVHLEVFSNGGESGKPDIDRDLPNSLPPPNPALLDRSSTGLAPNSDHPVKKVRFNVTNRQRGGEDESSESEEDQPPYYIGDYYPQRVRFH